MAAMLDERGGAIAEVVDPSIHVDPAEVVVATPFIAPNADPLIKEALVEMGEEYTTRSLVRTHPLLTHSDRADLTLTLCGHALPFSLALHQSDWRYEPDIEADEESPLYLLCESDTDVMQEVGWTREGKEDFARLGRKLIDLVWRCSEQYFHSLCGLFTAGQSWGGVGDQWIRDHIGNMSASIRQANREQANMSFLLPRIPPLSSLTSLTVEVVADVQQKQARLNSICAFISDRVCSPPSIDPHLASSAPLTSEQPPSSTLSPTAPRVKYTLTLNRDGWECTHADLQLPVSMKVWVTSPLSAPLVQLAAHSANPVVVDVDEDGGQSGEVVEGRRSFFGQLQAAIPDVEQSIIDEVHRWTGRMKLTEAIVSSFPPVVSIDSDRYLSCSFLFERMRWPCVAEVRLDGKDKVGRVEKVVLTSLVHFNLPPSSSSKSTVAGHALTMKEVVLNGQELMHDSEWSKEEYARSIRAVLEAAMDDLAADMK